MHDACGQINQTGPNKLTQQSLYFGIAIAASIVGITLCRSVSALLVAHLGYTPFMMIFVALLIGNALAVAVQGEVDNSAARSSILARYRQSVVLIFEPVVLVRLLVGGLLFFGYLGIATYLTFRLAAEPFGLNTAQIGIVNIAGLIAVVGAPGAGAAIPRWGSLIVGVCGLVCAITGALIIWQAESLIAVTLSLILLFLGTFATQPVKLVELSASVGPARRGAVSSLYLLVCLLMGGLSATFLGPLWAAQGWNGVAAASVGALCLALIIHLFSAIKPSAK